MTTSSEIAVALAVEPHAHHGAVEDQPHDRFIGQRAGVPGVPIALHLAPDPAHRVLAHRTPKQCTERTAHPARVGASEVGARNQRAKLQETFDVNHTRVKGRSWWRGIKFRD